MCFLLCSGLAVVMAEDVPDVQFTENVPGKRILILRRVRALSVCVRIVERTVSNL